MTAKSTTDAHHPPLFCYAVSLSPFEFPPALNPQLSSNHEPELRVWIFEISPQFERGQSFEIRVVNPI